MGKISEQRKAGRDLVERVDNLEVQVQRLIDQADGNRAADPVEHLTEQPPPADDDVPTPADVAEKLPPHTGRGRPRGK